MIQNIPEGPNDTSHCLDPLHSHFKCGISEVGTVNVVGGAE